MTVETVAYIDDLDPTYPAASDGMAEGDNHLRNIKLGLKQTFPNVAGATDCTHTQLTDMDNKLALLGEVKFLCHTTLPSGSKWLEATGPVLSQTTYSALYALVGTTWNTGGEGSGNFRGPDFRDRYPRGKGTTLSSLGYAAQQLLTHGHTASASSSASVSVTVNAGGSHSHTFSGTTGAGGSHSHTVGAVGSGIFFADGYPGGIGSFGTQTTSTASDHTHSFSGSTSTESNHTHTASASASVTTSVTVNDYSGGTENRPNSIVLTAIFKALP